MSVILNRTIQDIIFDGKTFSLTIAIKNSFIDSYDSFHFEIIQRNTENAYVIPYHFANSLDDYNLYQVDINPQELADFFSQGNTFDLGIVRIKGEEEVYSRVKSNYDNIEFLRYYLTDKLIFYPATTKMGNVSFYIKEDFLLAKIDELTISTDTNLTLQGLFLPPKEVEQSNIELQISSSNDESTRIPITHKYSSDELSNHIFQADLNLSEYMIKNHSDFLKFHLLLTTPNGQVIQSHRIKINHVKQNYPVRKVFIKGKEKYRVTVKPTQQSKYLSIGITEYKLLKELKQTYKEKWIHFRRSKELLKIFTYAFRVLGRIMPVNKKLVMFESFHGKQYSDNPRAIYEYMQKNNPEYKLVWSFDRRHFAGFQGRDIKMVRRFSIRWLLVMTRAKYWVTNARLPLWIPKPKHTIYLQTWHGTPLKRLAADMEEVHMPGTNTEKYKKNFINEASKWDYLISPNRYSSKIFRRAFQFQNEMLETGYPRNDFLYNKNTEEDVAKVKSRLGIATEKKVILYAPTWRDNQFYRKGKYKFHLELDLEKMRDAFGDSYVVVLRLHYLVSENLDISGLEGFVYDFSTHEDIRDLYVAADMLITDYSSVFFDYANLKRPMFFFVYDIEEYRDNLRGFYFDFEEKAPGPLTRTTDELIVEIQQAEAGEFTYNKDFYQRFCYLEDGNAAKRVVQNVFK
ncbi:CDP-glycerol glycerophosphotransferase family protein [Ornithinibacillus californiensis]|uniref:CDP-glycerol glycerophosphotransferase family protein n=1 Tax=Ornithinibacillus californiensis TaxID=161536 RepID=UPI00064DFFED|nr:CDP-glycerol glycerophosphotransferase family protein [Ornithinibacillus californiensis]